MSVYSKMYYIVIRYRVTVKKPFDGDLQRYPYPPFEELIIESDPIKI